jgi:hypothetical protein
MSSVRVFILMYYRTLPRASPRAAKNDAGSAHEIGDGAAEDEADQKVMS